MRIAVTLSGPAGTGGARVNLTGSNNAVVNLAGRQIRINANATSASADFYVYPGPADTPLSVWATLGQTTQTTSIVIPNSLAALASLEAPAVIGVNQWALATVSLTGPAPVSGPSPVVATSGVISQTTWTIPIAYSRSQLRLAFRSSAIGTGTISVSYGGVTKTVAITVK